MRLNPLKAVQVCGVAALVVVLFGTAGRATDYFAALDVNQDDILSGTEAAMVSVLDQDGDGEVTRQEYAAGMIRMKQNVREMQTQKFQSLDTNRDGRLSGREISEDIRGYDANGDGRIPLDEYLASTVNLQPQFDTLTADQVVEVANEIFQARDANRDGRLSGKELEQQFQHYDINGDQRVSLEEFQRLAVPEIFSASERDAPPPGSMEAGPRALRSLIEAVQAKSSKTLYQSMHPALREQVDQVLLDFVLEYLHDRLGRLTIPSSEDLARDPGTDPAENRWLVTLNGSQGNVNVNAHIAEGQMIGFNYAGPIMNDLGQALNSKLRNDQKFSRTFADYYSPACQKLIRLIDRQQDDAAFAMIHPDVQKQVGKEKFNAVFDFIRQHLGKIKAIDLEALRLETDANDQDAMIHITHRVTGTAGNLLVSVDYQTIGLKSHIVGVSASSSEEDDSTPQPPAPPLELVPVAPPTPAAPIAPLVPAAPTAPPAAPVAPPSEIPAPPIP